MAEGHFKAAAALEEGMGTPAFVAHTRYWHAWMLARRGATGDARRARSLLREVRAVALDLDLTGLERQSASLTPVVDRVDAAAVGGGP